MAKIPVPDTLTDKIERGMVTLENREYIGMSGLGGPCSRKIWYDFHWACDRKVTKRIKRIFDRGDLEEERVCIDLIAAGMKVSYVLNNQIEIIDKTGHIKGHPDGRVECVPTAEKTPHLLEIKTMNNRLFKLYVKNGLKKSNPTYWRQVHIYMGELGLKRCLFIVTNKDNEERHYERIRYDKQTHDDYMSRGMDILTSEFAPKKIGESTWFECKWCDDKGICHSDKPINRNCRTCHHVNIEMEGQWSCGLYGHWLNKQEQLLGCEDYQLSEVF